MEWLNYHHLYYFWAIAHEGGLTPAARRLRLTHSTLSAQLKALEDFLGAPLFDRRGRGLALTPFGGQIMEYATDIFRLGGELVDVARGRAVARRSRLRLGVVGALPRTIVYRLLEPAMAGPDGVGVAVRQAPLEELMTLLESNRLQLVLADSPPPEGAARRIHAHLLGGTGILLYGVSRLAARYRAGFPSSLDGAPVVMPPVGSSLRAAMERWFVDRGVALDVAAEVDDAGLLRTFGALGRGLFPIRTVLQREVEETYKVSVVGAMDGIEERYYAIVPERKLTNPATMRIIAAGRSRLGWDAPAGRRSRSPRP